MFIKSVLLACHTSQNLSSKIFRHNNLLHTLYAALQSCVVFQALFSVSLCLLRHTVLHLTLTLQTHCSPSHFVSSDAHCSPSHFVSSDTHAHSRSHFLNDKNLQRELGFTYLYSYPEEKRQQVRQTSIINCFFRAVKDPGARCLEV